MKKALQLLIAFCWMIAAHAAFAGAEQQHAFLTSKGSYIVAKVDASKLKNASTAASRMDYFITQQYLSKFTIEKEKHAHLRQWMTLVSQLTFSGNVITAQLLVNEIKVKQENITALPILRRIVNESTLVVDDDTLFVQSQSRIDEANTSFKAWPTIERECAGVMVMASVYSDDVAYQYATQCLAKFPQKQVAITKSAEVRAAIATLRKGVK